MAKRHKGRSKVRENLGQVWRILLQKILHYYAPAVTNQPNIINKGAHSAVCGTKVYQACLLFSVSLQFGKEGK